MIGTLTPQLEDAGEELARALERAGLRVRAALWIHKPGAVAWKLLLGIDEVDSAGPLDVYKRVYSSIQASPTLLSTLDFGDVSVTSPDEPLLKGLKKFVRTCKKPARIRLSQNSINGIYVDQALVYRVT